MPLLPRTLKVGPHRYRIRRDTSGMLDSAGRAGQTRHSQLVIDISSEAAPSMLADCLLHETLHACLDSLGIPDDEEERLVASLTPTLLGALRDNPALVAFLLEAR